MRPRYTVHVTAKLKDGHEEDGTRRNISRAGVVNYIWECLREEQWTSFVFTVVWENNV